MAENGMANGGNLVDERFELVSLVFRLAGDSKYGVADTGYQRELDSRFDAHKRHPVVEYARQNLGFGYDAVFNMAVHLEKAGGGFALVGNIGYLLDDKWSPRWNRENANTFVELLNDFYADAGFAGFFAEHSGLYAELSESFGRDYLGRFNFKWFEAHGVNPGSLKVVLSPAGNNDGYGSIVYGAGPCDSVAYAALCVPEVYPKDHKDYNDHASYCVSALACLFAYSFAGPVAKALYAENEEFRKWCDDSVDLALLPSCPDGQAVAYRYAATAYGAMYMAENAETGVELVLGMYKENGLAHIEDVYALISKTK